MVLRFTEKYCAQRSLLSMTWAKDNRKLFIEKLRNPKTISKTDTFTRSQLEAVSKRFIRAYHFPQLTDKQFLRDYWYIPDYEIDIPPEVGESSHKTPRQQCLIMRLEKRLDTFLFRCHFAESFLVARRLIEEGNVKINQRTELRYGHLLEPGDLITIDPKVTPFISGRASFNKHDDDYSLIPQMAVLPEYIEVDYLTCSAIFLRDPLIFKHRIDVPTPFKSSYYEAAFDHYSRKHRALVKGKSKKLIVNQCTYINGELTGLKKKFNDRLDDLEKGSNVEKGTDKSIPLQYPKRVGAHRTF